MRPLAFWSLVTLLGACAPAPVAVCGDGVVEGTEGCDDGNTVTEACAYGESSCTVCGSDCQPAAGATSVCGDGTLDAAHEGCDLGSANTDTCAYGETSCTVCGPSCQWSAGTASYCGDGLVDPTHEACDPGGVLTSSCPYGETSCQVCTADCQWTAGVASYCGDGTRDPAHEECDDGNLAPGDGCSADCTVEPGYVCYGVHSVCSLLPTCSSGSTISGSVTITSAQDLAAFVAQGCTAVTGDLTIVGTSLTSLVAGGTLPAVTSVGGTLRIAGNAGLAEIVLPTLAQVGSLEISTNAALTAVSLPELTTVTTVEQCTFNDQGVRSCQGGVRIGSNAALVHVSAPALTTITALALEADPALVSVELPLLASAAQLELASCTGLETLVLPSLVSVGTLSLQTLDALGSVAAPLLATASNLVVSDDRSLTELSLPALTTITGVSITGNDALGSFAAPLLASAARLTVTGNSLLATLEVPELVMQGTGYFNFIRVQDNPALGSCDALAVLDRSRASGFGGLALVTTGTPAESCSAVTSCAGPIQIGSAADWTALLARGCTEVAGDLKIEGAADDLAGDLEVQAVDGVLHFSGNTAATSLSAPLLTEVFDTLEILDDVALTGVSLPSLQWTAVTSIRSNPGLTSLSLPALTTAGSLGVVANANLTALVAPTLTTVSFSLAIRDNPKLPACQAQALFAQLTVAPPAGQVTLTGNDASGSCSP